MRKVERALKDRLRKKLKLRPRSEVALDLNGYARTLGINPSFELPETTAVGKQRRERQLQTLLFEDDFERRLRAIDQQAREAREEYGIDTLFLVFGFLEWYPPVPGGQADVPILSPLLLQPVGVERKRQGRKPSTINGRKLLANENDQSLDNRADRYQLSGDTADLIENIT